MPYPGAALRSVRAVREEFSRLGAIPAGAYVKSYPLVEYHALWIWMGDTAAANPNLIPDFSIYDDTDLACSRGYLRVKADYQLITDNLLNVSHGAFLHPFLTTPGLAERSRSDVTQEDTVIWSYLWNDNEPITPLFRLVWDGAGDCADMRTHMRWTAPSNLHLDVGVTDVGAGSEVGPALPSAHLLTPESETSPHYFWMIGRNRRQNDIAIGRQIHQGIDHAFTTENEPMIVRIAENMQGQEFWSLHPSALQGDIAGIRARTTLAKLIAREQASGAPSELPPGLSIARNTG